MCGILNIGRIVHDEARVARAYPECRRTGAVRSFNHARAAGRHDQVGLLHDLFGHVHRNVLGADENILRRAVGF
ncbi:hypothetical protein SDC9_201662 [bioreactor metagenome]|uniref:Uncharacterized protein n=1 Tax=bioreactor metagenome TaxID=1076179 RepID=A0A645J3E3_9ZZZZ